MVSYASRRLEACGRCAPEFEEVGDLPRLERAASSSPRTLGDSLERCERHGAPAIG